MCIWPKYVKSSRSSFGIEVVWSGKRLMRRLPPPIAAYIVDALSQDAQELQDNAEHTTGMETAGLAYQGICTGYRPDNSLTLCHLGEKHYS